MFKFPKPPLRTFGSFPCHIIEPDLKPVQYGGRTYYILPKVMFSALFQTYETTQEADAIGSALIVIWFQQNFQAHPSDPIAAELKALDWTTEAQDFDL